MRKMLFSLVSACCLSASLQSHPHNTLPNLHDVVQQGVMISCAVKYMQAHPYSYLSINSLTANKPKLVRDVSDAIHSSDKLPSQEDLVDLLARQHGCPVPVSPVTKRRKVLAISAAADCVVPTKTPPTSPRTKQKPMPSEFLESATKQVSRLHRQWTSKWKSDTDLQSMLQEEAGTQTSFSERKRATSHSN